MPAKNTYGARVISIVQAANNLRQMFNPRVLDTWLQEFGYTSPEAPSPFIGAADPLEWAVMERGGRIRNELVAHSKRLADRAQMRPPMVQGKTTRIAP